MTTTPPSAAGDRPSEPQAVELQTVPDPAATVIWLHGLGADGYDFVPIVRELESLGAPAARYVFPHAPMRPVTINGGYVMRAWYDILGTDLDRREDEAGIRASQAAVENLIAREVARGTPPARIVLAGFSQGGAIALHSGLRRPQPLAGLVALSCYLPLVDRFEAERHPASARVPIFLAHGNADPVVPIARGVAARDRLVALGHPVAWHEYPMPHSVCAEQIRDIAAFLRDVLR
ncbi:MAG: alpha/beta hydrolase [Burkholderiaceae bacterium]